MTQWHMKAHRTASGGIHYARTRCDKKLAWKGGDFAATTIGTEAEIVTIAGRGGTTKAKARKVLQATVIDQKTGKASTGTIVTVSGNGANRHYVRRNTITKGAILTVKLGDKQVKARVTSRPGQAGAVQTILTEETAGVAGPKGTEKSSAGEKKAKKAVKAPKKA